LTYLGMMFPIFLEVFLEQGLDRLKASFNVSLDLVARHACFDSWLRKCFSHRVFLYTRREWKRHVCHVEKIFDRSRWPFRSTRYFVHMKRECDQLYLDKDKNLYLRTKIIKESNEKICCPIYIYFLERSLNLTPIYPRLSPAKLRRVQLILNINWNINTSGFCSLLLTVFRYTHVV